MLHDEPNNRRAGRRQRPSIAENEEVADTDELDDEHLVGHRSSFVALLPATLATLWWQLS